MRAIVFATQAAALAGIASLDAVLGYPRDGVDIGGGVHAPAAASRTATWAIALPHPTDVTKWAVVYRDRLQKLTTAACEQWVVAGTFAGGLTAKQRAELEAEVMPRSRTQAQYDALKAKLLTSVELTADWFPAT